MTEDRTPTEQLSAIGKRSIEQARSAMETYFKLFEKSFAAFPWGGADLNKRMKSYAEQNIANSLAYAQRLSQANDFEDIVRIQTEFMQTQLKALGEQAKEIREISSKASTGPN